MFAGRVTMLCSRLLKKDVSPQSFICSYQTSKYGIKGLSIQRLPAFRFAATRKCGCLLSEAGESVTKAFVRKTMTVAASRFQPLPRTQRIVGYWLAGCSGMVFCAVVLGGVTRLTESGLSMVTWRLLGESMPTTLQQWEDEFQRYQQFPEFQLKNSNITLEEFKFIWWMEYAHRQWGRLIGAAFFIPATVFWAKGWLNPVYKKRVIAFGTLILLQGLMGWYMVKSGLESKFDGPSDVPRVSQYRLAAHLSLAFILYSLLLWSALDHLLPAERVNHITKAAAKFRTLAHSCKGLIFFTAVSGAFVAGLDAGLIYNSFPKMADKWIPDDILAFSPAPRNFTENPSTVQFDHRLLGISTLTLVSGMWLLSRRRAIPRRAVVAANAVAAMAWLQVAMGITTLLTYIPVPVAAAHQSGSLVLLSFAVWLTHELKHIKFPK